MRDDVTLDSCQHVRFSDFLNLANIVLVKWYLSVILIFLITKKVSAIFIIYWPFALHYSIVAKNIIYLISIFQN